MRDQDVQDREELARTAEQFITIWRQYLDTGTLIHGYIIDNREFEQFALEDAMWQSDYCTI